MNILFTNETNFNLEEKYQNIILNVINQTLEYENFSKNVEVSISFVTNEEIKQINNKYRNINKETDVLSFPLIDFNIETINTNNIIILGDIIISIEKAISQAEQYGHSIEREIGFLTAHSMLHLLGYDHMEENEEKIMFLKQDEILKNINLNR